MDGLPRPIHLDHGMKNIQWNRDTKWVYDNIVGQQKTLEKTENCEVERTGLHNREFIDTMRYTLSEVYTVSMDDTVHVMNLVDGRSATIESVDGALHRLRYITQKPPLFRQRSERIGLYRKKARRLKCW